MAIGPRNEDRFWGSLLLRVTASGRPDQMKRLLSFVTLAENLNPVILATHPIQFLKPVEDFSAHEIRVCIARGEVLADKNRQKIYSKDQYLKSAEEMIDLFSDIPAAIANTVELAKRCNLENVLSKPQLPAVPNARRHVLDDYIDQLSREGLEARLSFLYPDEAERNEQRPRYIWEACTSWTLLNV